MNETITQNPIISLIIIFVPIVAIIWKTMETLYIKPREFRINTLEDNIDELKNVILKIEKKQSIIVKEQEIVTTEIDKDAIIPPNLSGEKVKKSKLFLNENILYQTLENLFNQWKNEDITELQRKKIEENSIGKIVTWDVYVESISKFGYDKQSLMLSAKANIDDYLSSPNTVAIFDIKYEDSLLLLQKGDKITITGKIEKFFLSPMLEDCNIIKKTT